MEERVLDLGPDATIDLQPHHPANARWGGHTVAKIKTGSRTRLINAVSRGEGFGTEEGTVARCEMDSHATLVLPDQII